VRVSASSQILCIVSKPFSKMLGPNFKEGQSDDGSTKKEIPLPADKPSAIELMCNIIHYRIHETSHTPAAINIHDLENPDLLPVEDSERLSNVISRAECSTNPDADALSSQCNSAHYYRGPDTGSRKNSLARVMDLSDLCLSG
jgi:hypothetical protein